MGRRRWPLCLLNYYNIPTTEAEALELAEYFDAQIGREPGKGVTALALKQTLEAKGIPTKGFMVQPEALRDYFLRGGLPIIAHLTLPQKHFVVVVGVIEDQIVLAYPSWGFSLIPFDSFIKERGYSEVVLVPIPPPELFPFVAERQKEALRRAEERLSTLFWLGEELP